MPATPTKTFAQFRLEQDGVPYVDEQGRDITFLAGYAREYALLYREGLIAAKRAAEARPVFTASGVEKMLADLNRVAADSLFSDTATSRAIERL